MTTQEKAQYLKEKGYTYNKETGKIYGSRGKEITRLHSNGYVNIGFRYKDKSYDIRGHQFGFYYTYGYVPKEIDHIDRNKTNNKIDNLRDVSRMENQWNRDSKGGYLDKRRNKYIGVIHANKKRIYLGMYESEESAKQAYDEAKKKFHTIE